MSEIISAIFLAVFVGLFPSKAWAQQPQQIVERLDNLYYYPHHHGLNKLSARIRWEQLDISSTPGKYLRNPEFTFHWDSSSGHAEKYFAISDETFERSKTRERELLTLLDNYNEMIIPLTLRERLSHFKGTVKQTRQHKIQIDFDSQDLDNPIRKYSFLIDLKDGIICKMKIHQDRVPREVKAELTYLKKGGLWLLFASLSHFEINGQTFSETTRYSYRRVQSFWLASKMEQTLRRNGQIVRSYKFRMDNYRLN